MSYRDDLQALHHRSTALEQEISGAQRELLETRRLLAETEARRRLSVLDNIVVAAPCKADWAKMTGDERARCCGSCEKNVYNLSSMTRVEAEALLVEKEGKLCVRYYQRADGTILTADCPDGVARRRRKRRVVAATFTAMSAVAAAASMMSGASRRGVMMGAPMPVQQATVVPTTPVVDAPVVRMGEPAIAAPRVMMGKIRLAPPPLPPKRGSSKIVAK